MAKKTKTYDVVVIGSGSAGFSAAMAARAVGVSVCLVEKGKLGGECPNFACVPSKALLKAAGVYRTALNTDRFGVHTKRVSYNFQEVMAYRGDVVKQITGGGEYGDRYVKLAKQNDIEIKYGAAKFIDEKTIEVNGESVKGKAFVISTGTVDFIPPIDGLEDVGYLGWKDVNDLERQPKSLAVIGGGPVGTEMTTVFNTFGTDVKLFQAADTILNNEDAEIAKMAHRTLKEQGVELYGNALVKRVEQGRAGIRLDVEIAGDMQSFEVEEVLVATGKRSNVDGLQLEDAGVTLTERGAIDTNTEQRTSVKHIYAAGDVEGGLRFTHTAHYEGSIAGNNAAMTAKGHTRKGFERGDERVVPRVTFMKPEVASVGMTAEQVKEKHGKVMVGRAKIAQLGRSVTEHDRKGMVKIVAHPKTGKILGCHIMAGRAGEMIHEGALAMFLRANIDQLAEMIHAFPTYSEGIAAAASNTTIET